MGGLQTPAFGIERRVTPGASFENARFQAAFAGGSVGLYSVELSREESLDAGCWMEPQAAFAGGSVGLHSLELSREGSMGVGCSMEPRR
jgi:hypothetical protein